MAVDSKTSSLPNNAKLPAFLSSFLALNLGARKISDVFQKSPGLEGQFLAFHPIKSAALVAGILTEPSLLANTVRLELLVHLLMAFGGGNSEPKIRRLRSWLNADLGATKFGMFEDPVEDVFVSNVTTAKGNSRIFNGIWESSDFYLQRVLNVVETLQDNSNVKRLKREVYAALRLSDEIAARRQLARFSLGAGRDKMTIPVPSLIRLKLLRRAIEFSCQDLERLGVPLEDLEPFVFRSENRSQLQDQFLGDSELERHPIAHDAGKWFVLLPAAISIAVRHHILRWMSGQGYQDTFDQGYVSEYQKLLKDIPVFGSPLPQRATVPSDEIAGKRVMELCKEVDTGRYVQMIAIVDGLEGYQTSGFSSPDASFSKLSEEIRRRVKNAQLYFRKQKEFKQGLTLLVMCGYGRPGVFGLPAEGSDWMVENISAPDLETLAWVPGSEPLLIWKLVDHERFLAKNGISIANANGLLNLYGWWSESSYRMLYPEVDFGGGPVNLMIPTDCLVKIRTRVRQGWDVHSLPLPDGKFVRVRRGIAESYFPSDVNIPLYTSIDGLSVGNLLGACVGKRLIWWLGTIINETGLSRSTVFQLWNAVNNWMERAVPIFERLVENLSGEAVLISLNFSELHQEQADLVSELEIRSSVLFSVDRHANTIQIYIRDPFMAGIRNPKNVAERAIVRAIIEGVLALSDEIVNEQTVETFLREIIPNEDARHVHLFQAVYFRDRIQQFDRPEGLFIEDADIARSKLGLGWLCHDRNAGNRLTTVDQSVTFLNRAVQALWERIRPQLHRLNRASLIERVLRHIEGVEADKKQWERTIRAVLALREDKVATKTVAMQQIARCNAAELTSRLVAEMAVSESPLEAGESVGALDLTRLMSDALSMFHLGGWSDAIWKRVMDPEIEIRPSGEILSHVEFRSQIVAPLAQQFGSLQLDNEASNYERHFEPAEPIVSVEGRLSQSFLRAFEDEFGLSIDALRGVREAFEDLAIEKRKCVFITREDEILSHCARSEVTEVESAKVVLDHFVLWPRERWDVAPPGFDPKDFYPWRFGRRLSLVQRPLIRLENSNNPRYAISPGLLGVGITHTLNRYYQGEVQVSQCKSATMRRWISDETNRRGHAFAQKVLEILQGLKYEGLLEVTVSGLLNEKLDRNFGDIDVLAWKPGQDEILAIECKDLRLAKTPNEMAEQLNRFSGQVLPSGDHDDLLKHIERCEFLRTKFEDVARAIGMGQRRINIRTVVCFSRPVPMKYVAMRFPNVTFLTVDEICREGIA